MLVTGADGFIGSHLVEDLVSRGHTVTAFVQYTSAGTWGWLDMLDRSVIERVKVVAGDVRDAEQVASAVAGQDVVFHLAALIAIPFSYEAPQSYVDTNVSGTLNVLQAVRRHRTRRVLVTSTSEVYGTARYAPIDETHPRQPQSPYAATKIAADCLAESFWRSFDLPVTIVRPFNTYGPRQSTRAVIPTIATQMLAGCPQIRLGSLHPTRDLVFVRDTAAAFSLIAGCDRLLQTDVNIATGVEHSVGDLVDLLRSLTGSEAELVSEDARLRPERSEVDRLLGDATKLRSATGWSPPTGLSDGLAATVAWLCEPGNLQRYRTDRFHV